MAASVLELNIKAKPKLSPPSFDKVKLEIGKKYIDTSGNIWEVLKETSYPQHPTHGKAYKAKSAQLGTYLFYSNGLWQSKENEPTWHWHLIREFISDEYEAWFKGKPVQIKYNEVWHSVATKEKLIQLWGNLTCPSSKQYINEYLMGKYPMKILP